MKKLIKLLAASAMLVGLAACGEQPAPSWNQRVTDWLKKNGCNVITELPVEACKDYKAKVEEFAGDEDYAPYISVTFNTVDSYELWLGCCSELMLGEQWGLFTEDDSFYDYGAITDEFISVCDEEGSGAYLILEAVFADSYLSGDDNEDAVVALTFYAETYSSAEEATAVLDEVATNMGTTSVFAEGESLEAVADWFYVDFYNAEYTDLSVVAGESMAAAFEEDYDAWATDYYYEDYGITEVYFDDLSKESITTAEAAATFLKGLLVQGGFTMGDVAESTDCPGDFYADGVSADGTIAVEAYAYVDEDELIAYVDFMAATEEAFILTGINVGTIDLEGEGSENFLDVVDNTKWSKDRTLEAFNGNIFVRAKAVNDAGLQPTALINSSYGMFTCDFSLSDKVFLPWPTAKISTFTQAFTNTTVPSLERDVCLLMEPSAEFGGYVIFAYDAAADDEDEGYTSLGLQYKELLVESQWSISSITEDGEKYWVAKSNEVVEDKVITMLFGTNGHIFMWQISIELNPQYWANTGVNEFVSGFGFVDSPIPQPTDTKIWNISGQSDDTFLWLYADEGFTGLYNVYKQAWDPEKWSLTEQQQQTTSGSVIYVSTATSEESVTIQGTKYCLEVTFYQYEDSQFSIQVELAEVKIVFPTARINELLAEQGWDLTLDLSALGKIFTGYTETYNEQKDAYLITMYASYADGSGDAFDAINQYLSTAVTLLDGPYAGPNYNPTYYQYDYIFGHSSDGQTYDLYVRNYFEGYNTGDLLLQIYIGQAPVEE